MPTVTIRGFARLFDTDHGQVSKWVAAGMPAGAPRRGSKGREINVRQAVDWLIAREVAKHRAGDGGESLAAAELRKLRADADRQELRVVERADAVVDQQDVADVLDRVLVIAGEHLDSLPDRVDDRLAETSDPATIRDIVFSATRQVRARIAADLDPV